MAKKKSKTKKVKFIIKYDKNHNIIHPTDAMGSISPKGDLVVNFITDIYGTPYFIKHEVDKQNKIKEKSQPENLFEDGKSDSNIVAHVDRIIHSTVILNPEDAINIACWMLKNLVESPLSDLDKDKLKKRIDFMLEE